MRTKEESSTLAEMLSLLPVPNHNFTSFSTVEKRTCKWVMSTIFLVRVPGFHPSRAKNFLPCKWGLSWMLFFHSTQTVSTSQTSELLHFLQKACYEKHFSFVYVWWILSEIFENNPFKFVTNNGKGFFFYYALLFPYLPLSYLWYSSLEWGLTYLTKNQ